MSDLKPCPFCGGGTMRAGKGIYNTWEWVCCGCEARGPFGSGDVSPTHRWNARTPDPETAALRAENERLRGERPYIVGWNDGFAFATSAHDYPEEHLHSEGAADIARERERQMLVEGWTEEHDDQHRLGEMATAARCYALINADLFDGPPTCWPWADRWWKPKSRRENLARAGALIAAEIDRLDRAALSLTDGEGV